MFNPRDQRSRIKLRQKEIDNQSEDGYTIVVRPQAEGGYVIMGVNVATGTAVNREFVESREEVAKGVASVARMMDKLGLGDGMAHPSRVRNYYQVSDITASLGRIVQATMNQWTAQQIADHIEAALAVSYREFWLHAKVRSIGGDYVSLFFANVPKNASQVQVANATHKMTVEIGSASSLAIWQYGESAPATLKAGPSISITSPTRPSPKKVKMPQMVGTPQEVVDAVIAWFTANAKKLQAS